MDNTKENETLERLERPLDYNQILFRQIERVNNCRTIDVFNDTLQMNVWGGHIQQLASLLDPFKDDEWTGAIEKLGALGDEEVEGAEDMNQRERKSVCDRMRMEIWQTMFTECIRLMHRKGLLLYREGYDEL